MVKVNKQLKKQERKKKMRNFRQDALQYVIGYPIYYTIIKPCELINNQYIKYRDAYYLKRFEIVEKKALDEMKLYATKCLSEGFKSFSLTEEGTYEQDEDMCVQEFLRKYTFRYGKKGRKYSMLYGKLFPEKVKENHLIYMNELIMWLIDEGCRIKYFKIWSGNHRIGVLSAKLAKED